MDLRGAAEPWLKADPKDNETMLRSIPAGTDIQTTTMRQPSAFIPLVMSLAALALVIIHVAMNGVAREADEGTAAHLWQLLMVGQVPVIAFFAITWLPRRPRQALGVLALQAAAVVTAAAPVFLLGL
jgi:hypothetical protein